MARPDYYDAPECDTQEKGAPKFCKRSEPGEGTERSCAFDGARVVLMPVTDAIHLVHGPIACAGNSWDNRGARSSGSQLYRRGFTTEMLQNDVVFGGEKKLHRAIVDLAARYPEAKAIFVYATCVTAMTGDDVEAVCRGGVGGGADPGDPGEHARVHRRQEHREPARRRDPARARHRHRRAGDDDRPTT